MKKLLPVLLCIMICGLKAGAQHITQPKEDVEKLVTGPWRPDHAVMGQMIIGQLPPAASFKLDFKANHSYSVAIKNGKTENGTWHFFADKKYIELSINGRITSRVTTLTTDGFIFEPVSGPKDPKDLPQLQVFFVRDN